MRIRLFKVGEKGRVGESLHARSIVGHDIEVAGQIVSRVQVTVFTLVRALDIAEVRCRGLAEGLGAEQVGWDARGGFQGGGGVTKSIGDVLRSDGVPFLVFRMGVVVRVDGSIGWSPRAA